MTKARSSSSFGPSEKPGLVVAARHEAEHPRDPEPRWRPVQTLGLVLGLVVLLWGAVYAVIRLIADYLF